MVHIPNVIMLMLMLIPDHCLDCTYRNVANQSTSKPEKRQSRVRQIQQ